MFWNSGGYDEQGIRSRRSYQTALILLSPKLELGRWNIPLEPLREQYCCQMYKLGSSRLMLGTRRFTVAARTSSPGVGIPFVNDLNISHATLT